MQIHALTLARRATPFFLIAMLALFFGTSCNRKKGSKPDTISRNEANKLIRAIKKYQDLKKQLEEHFSEEGYTFTFVYQLTGEKKVSTLAQGPSLLKCDGTSDRKTALHADTGIRRVLGPEELQRLEILYEVKNPYGGGTYYVSAKQLSSYVESHYPTKISN